MNIITAIKLWGNIKDLQEKVREEGMLGFLEGYKTYLTLIVLIVHQGMKLLKLDPLPDEQVSIAFDVLLGIVAGIFRKVAKPKT